MVLLLEMALTQLAAAIVSPRVHSAVRHCHRVPPPCCYPPYTLRVKTYAVHMYLYIAVESAAYWVLHTARHVM